MATLDWHYRRLDGVTLVELLLTSETAQTVRIESQLTPVWPPRRQGLPAPGWRNSSFSGTIEPGERLVLGYASPEPPTDPPATLDTEPRTDDRDTQTPEPSPRDLVRLLGDGLPPRDAVGDATAPAPSADSPNTCGTGSQGGVPNQTPPARSSCSTSPAHCSDPTPPTPSSEFSPSRAAPEQPSSEESHADVPAPVDSWFEEVEAQLRQADELAAVSDVESARAKVAELGGIEAVRRLERSLATERARLDHLAKRQQALACRLDTVDVAVDTLERVV